MSMSVFGSDGGDGVGDMLSWHSDSKCISSSKTVCVSAGLRSLCFVWSILHPVSLTAPAWSV